MKTVLTVANQKTTALRNVPGGSIIHFDNISTAQAIEQNELFFCCATKNLAHIITLANTTDGLIIERDGDRMVVVVNASINVNM